MMIITVWGSFLLIHRIFAFSSKSSMFYEFRITRMITTIWVFVKHLDFYNYAQYLYSFGGQTLDYAEETRNPKLFCPCVNYMSLLFQLVETFIQPAKQLFWKKFVMNRIIIHISTSWKSINSVWQTIRWFKDIYWNFIRHRFGYHSNIYFKRMFNGFVTFLKMYFKQFAWTIWQNK